MKVEAVVTELKENGYAVIETKRKSACAECHKDSCGACDLFLGDDRFSALARNDAGAAVGDTVVAESPDKNIILNAFTVFILPLLFGFGAYLFGSRVLRHGEGLCALYSLGAVALCFLIIFAFTKVRKGVGNKIFITEIVKHNEEKM